MEQLQQISPAQRKYIDSLQEEYKHLDPVLRENMGILLANQMEGVPASMTYEALTEAYQTSGLVNTGYNSPYSDGTIKSYGELEAQFPFMALNLMRTAGPQPFTHVLCNTQAIDRANGSAYVMKIRHVVDPTNPATWPEANFNNTAEMAGVTGRQNSVSGNREFMVDGVVGPNGETGRWYDLSGRLGGGGAGKAGFAAKAAVAEQWGIGDQGEFRWPELSISVERQSVTAQSRKVGASFSVEFLQDSTSNGLNIMPIMMKALKKNLVLDIERETLARVRNLAFRKGSPTAVTRPDWVAEYGCSDYFTYYVDCTKVGGLWPQQKYGEIANSLVCASYDLLMRNHAGAGNIAVVSPSIATILHNSGPQFRGVDVNVNPDSGVPEIGTLNGTIKVYVDSQARDDVAIVAYKGSDLAESGLIYCPYKINMEFEALHQSNFGKRIGVMNRYGWCVNNLGADLFYSTIYFANAKKLLRDGGGIPILTQVVNP